VLHQKIEKEKTLVTQWNNCEVLHKQEKIKQKNKNKNWAGLWEFIISLGTSWNICYLTVISLN
jgi:hypothetical protein